MPRRLFGVFGVDHLLALASIGWLVAVCHCLQDSPAAVWGTLALLVADAAAGLTVLVKEKRLPLLLNLAQLALFALVHSQIYSAWGAEHYAVDRVPTGLDWVGFTAAHVLRAADVLDFLEEYDIDLQHVTHASRFAGVLLVAMHLTVDIFLVGLLVRWLRRLWAKLRRRRVRARGPGGSDTGTPEEGAGLSAALRTGRFLGLGVCVVAFAVTTLRQGWDGADWMLWPLETILRLVDVGDAMNVFHWQFHGRPSSFWLSTLAVLTRLFAGLWIAEWLVRLQVQYLGGAMRTVGDLAEDLSHPDPAVRRAALALLHDHEFRRVLRNERSSLAEALPALAAALADPDREVREAAANTLPLMRPPAVPGEMLGQIPILIAVLAGGEPVVQRVAAKILSWLGPAALPAIPVLVAALGDKEESVRSAAADALGDLGPAAVPAINGVLTGGSPVTRAAAARALGGVRPQSAAVPGLTAALTDPAPRVREAAAYALRGSSEAAAGPLKVALQDPSPNVRVAAAEALARSDLGAALPVLAACVKGSSYEAVWALARLGPAAVPALLTAVVGGEYNFRWAAVKNIREMGWRAVEPLLTAMADKDPAVRAAAAEVLGYIGGELGASHSMLDALTAAKSDGSNAVRVAAEGALEWIARARAGGLRPERPAVSTSRGRR